MSNGIASSSELRHRQVEVDGIPVHVVEAGSSDKPTLLFLHGWPESSIASSPFARYIETTFPAEPTRGMHSRVNARV
jgi:pimeloyl-ACP methyl ester carboxylesterase